MSAETVLAVLASSFGVVMGVSPMLQIRRMLMERSSRDVSIGYFVIIACGSVLWASYGVSIDNVAILIPNVVGALSAVATILVAHRLRRNDQLSARGTEGGGHGKGEDASLGSSDVDVEVLATMHEER